jgi:exonuclease-1
MGITGLLPLLRSITDEVDLSQYAGLTIGVDGYVWLHRGIYGCASQLAAAIEAATLRATAAARTTGAHEADSAVDLDIDYSGFSYVRYCEAQLGALLAAGIRPYFVFDGAPLPAKQGKEAERRQARAEALESAKRLSQQRPPPPPSVLASAFARAVDVTPAMAVPFLQALRAKGVPFLVAPYEADAQLAFLSREGLLDGVLTEDSDLLPYGVDLCLFKMRREADRDGRAGGGGGGGGGGSVRRASSLPPAAPRPSATSSLGAGRAPIGVTVHETRLGRLGQASDPSFVDWTRDQFLHFCILCGCDYLDSVPGVGPKYVVPPSLFAVDTP